MQAANPDAFRLSSVQQGILTHHLHRPKSDAGVVQLAQHLDHFAGRLLEARRLLDQLDADAVLALQALCGLQRARHDRSVGHNRKVVPGTNDLRLAERHHVIRTGIRRAAKRLSVEALVLQE